MAADQGVPPSIDGYTYVRWLGGGGFADVFLYQQHLPERQVAIKVLRSSIDDEGARRLFVAEANLMAKVSSHPNIVTVYGAGVSTDRRPYLVMEYYPLDHYGERIAKGRVPHQQVLTVGVKVASAIETAHQAQIFHRDIKPANILSSDFGEPGLTDFGISATHVDGTSDESLGFTPAFAPPEILNNTHPGDERSDIYSLATTLWALLAGHSPFERPGVRNTRGDIIARGLNEPVPPLPAGVAPPALEAALRSALEKSPDRRPATARTFATMLQDVEQQLGFRATPLVLLHDRSSLETAIAEVAEAVERTKQGRGVAVDLAAHVTNPRGLIAGAPQGSMGYQRSADAPVPQKIPIPVAPDESATVLKGRVQSPAPVESEAPEGSVSRWVWAAAAAVAVGIAAIVISVFAGAGDDARPASPSSSPAVVPNPGATTPNTTSAITALEGVVQDGVATFTWSHPGGDSVTYLVERVDGSSAPAERVDVAQYVIDPVGTGEIPCLQVTAQIEGVFAGEAVGPVCATLAT